MSPLDRHERIALHLSGGKDSVACLYYMRNDLHRITVYNLDAGDDPPETKDVLNECRRIIPNYVEVKSDVRAWIKEHGFPSDIVPTSSSTLGRLMGFGELALSDRFACCWANIMRPMYERMKQDGITLIIRGVKKADMPILPIKSGESADGIEVYYPLENWTDKDVFRYLREVNAPIHSVYSVCKEGVSCMHCTAWWDYRLVDWLKVRHPKSYEIVARKHAEIRDAVKAQGLPHG